MPSLPKNHPTISINLLPQDPFLDGIIGKFLLWSLSIGRYIVVLTELIVILSFLSRFTLDRKLTDLNEAIVSQKNIILSYQETETKFLTVQANLEFLKKQQEQSTNVSNALSFLEKNLPVDVKLTKLAVQPTSWTISASALSAEGMKATIDQAARANPLSEISVGTAKLDNRTGMIEFDVKVDFKPKNTVKVQPKKT